MQKKVIISSKAFRGLITIIQNKKEAEEIGGIIMGTDNSAGCYVSDFLCSKGKSNDYSIVMEGNTLMKKAKGYMKIHRNSLVLGLWHSHPSWEKSFSAQDRKTNKNVAEYNGDFYSFLVFCANNCSAEIKAYMIDKYGIEKNIDVEIEH